MQIAIPINLIDIGANLVVALNLTFLLCSSFVLVEIYFFGLGCLNALTGLTSIIRSDEGYKEYGSFYHVS